jgi:Flp pilus assembly pilin Flp
VASNEQKERLEMKSLMMSFLKDESGAQMAEYALLLVLIGVMIIAAALFLSNKINVAFHAVGNCIADPQTGCDFALS